MSLNLHCPNCYGVVGEFNDGQEIYHKSDENNQPKCPHCGAGDATTNFERNLLIGVVISVVIILSLLWVI
jgi:ribosomal protein S27AE